MSDASERPGTDPLDAGWAALTAGAWEDARACFEAAVSREETAEALEGLGWAAWWLNDAAATSDALERAYRRYRERPDNRGAARVAVALAGDHFYRRGEHAIANGWLRRAHRLLDGLDPGPEQATLAIWEGHIALTFAHDTAAARRLSAEAGRLARALGALDLEMLAQAIEGCALVREGAVAAGMRLLDEATAAAVSGEMTDLDAIVTTCCSMIDACERVRDYDRAAQWCDQAMRISARRSYRFMFSYCRAHYAGVLIWRGAWSEAEAELTAATDGLTATFPAMAVEGIVRLAELRRLQGRFEAAGALLDQLDTHPLRMLGRKAALLGRAALALDQGRPAAAADLAERFLRGVPIEDRTTGAAGLELLVRARTALGDHARAAQTLAELRAIAATVATPPLRASTNLCEGVVAVAAGDHEAARRWFEDAADLFEASGASYDAARSRLELAAVLSRLGRSDAAHAEAHAAHEAFARLGATRETDKTATLLGEIRGRNRGRGRDGGEGPNLTTRELDVLRLVARGLGDKEIAAHLGLSEHTVHRHVSNILTKLDLPSRAAAVALAAHHDLL